MTDHLRRPDGAWSGNSREFDFRVLIVGREPGKANAVASTLGDRVRVLYAADGVEALRMTREVDLDVIVFDVATAGIDGMKLAEQARKRRAGARMVLTSARGTVRDAVRALKAGAADYLCEPITAADLVDSIEGARQSYVSTSGHSVERVVILATGAVLQDDGCLAGRLGMAGVHAVVLDALAQKPYRDVMELATDAITRAYIEHVLAFNNGNVTRAAAQAGMERESLHRLLRRFRLRAAAFKPGTGL